MESIVERDLVRDKTIKSTLVISGIQKMLNRGELRKDHPQQRKPDQWSDSDKSGLVATVIKQEDVDSIKVCEQLLKNGGVALWIIDGIQRLTAICSYKQNIFKLNRGIEFPIIYYQSIKKDKNGNFLEDGDGNYIYEIKEFDLRGKYYDDLPETLKERFDNYEIAIVKHLNCTDEEIGYHIRRYNKQKSMNPSQSAVTYMDDKAKDLKKISASNPFFKRDIYDEKYRKNGTIDRIIMESIMSINHIDEWKKGKGIGAYLNNNASQKEFSEFNEKLCRLDAICNENFKKVFTSKDSFIWFTVFDKFTELDIDDNEFANFVNYFIEKTSGRNLDDFYGIDKKSSTKDKTVILKKLDIIESLMYDFLHINKDDLKDIDIFEFIKENVNPEVSKDDIEQYKEVLDTLTLNVINTSKLLNVKNNPSLMGVIAYSFKNDIDLDDWIVDFFDRNDTFIYNQKENYTYMINDLDVFIKNKEVEKK